METCKIRPLINALLFLMLIVCLAAICLFISAGSFKYWKAFLCIAEFYMLEAGLAIYLYLKNPELLAKRMNAKEEYKEQNHFTISAYIVIVISIFVLPGIDYRYEWTRNPDWISIVFAIVMAIAFVFEYIIVKENDYLFRTIEVTKEQRVVDQGLYSIVRHPMYLFGMIIILSMPLILGSIYGFIISFVFLVPLFVIRIKNEENVLSSGLVGYKEYMEKVKYRLIPFVW